MKWLLLFLATPGSFVIVGLILRAIVRKVSAEREADEDKARARRFANENGIPEEYVSIPKGRRRRSLPEIRSDYRGFRDEVSR